LSKNSYFLYEVEAFYDLMFGDQGAFTEYYGNEGFGQAVNSSIQLPDNQEYFDVLRYISSANDELYTITTLQKYLYKIYRRAAELIEDAQNVTVNYISADDIFNQDLIALIEYSEDQANLNSTQVASNSTDDSGNDQDDDDNALGDDQDDDADDNGDDNDDDADDNSAGTDDNAIDVDAANGN